MKKFKKMFCAIFAIMIFMTSVLTVNTQAKGVTAPKATQIVKVYNASHGIKVKWQVVNGVSGYQVQTARSKDFKKEKKTYTVAKPKTSAKTIGDFKAEKTYYFRVRTYKKSGKKTAYSKWSSVKKFKAPNFVEIDGNEYIVCTNNNNHQCVCGNVGKWFNSRKENVDYVEDEMDYWNDLEDKGIISWEEKCKKCPVGYECWSCGFCGKWTGDMCYRGDGDSSDTVTKDPPAHIN